jgi:hypothetical protein
MATTGTARFRDRIRRTRRLVTTKGSDSRRSNQRSIDLKSEFGLFPLTMVVCAAVGLLIALVSALSFLL